MGKKSTRRTPEERIAAQTTRAASEIARRVQRTERNRVINERLQKKRDELDAASKSRKSRLQKAADVIRERLASREPGDTSELLDDATLEAAGVEVRSVVVRG